MRVIIAGTDRGTVVFDGDEDPATLHYGLYGPGLLCCASLMRNAWEGEPAYQLRGMATEPAHQGHGYGTRLLDGIEADLRAEGSVRVLWCNARVAAAGFYERAGWTAVGEAFMIPGVGPHRKMFKRLE